jgi:hypothetical protein
MSPEMVVGPTQDAPPDRQTQGLEQLLSQALAIIGGDRRLDQNEKQIVRVFVEQLYLMQTQGGGIGIGGAPQAGGPQALPPSPAEMNQNTEDMGTAEGAQPEYEGAY